MSEFELRQRLRALRRDVEPPRDLWPAIAARLGTAQAAPVPAPRRRAGAWPEALAAMLVLALGAGTLLLREAPAPAASVAADATPWALREAQAIDLSYQAALGSAGPGLKERRPRELAAAETELDAAQAAIEHALRENPGSTHLLKLLQQTHDQRLRLYRREPLLG